MEIMEIFSRNTNVRFSNLKIVHVAKTASGHDNCDEPARKYHFPPVRMLYEALGIFHCTSCQNSHRKNRWMINRENNRAGQITVANHRCEEWLRKFLAFMKIFPPGQFHAKPPAFSRSYIRFCELFFHNPHALTTQKLQELSCVRLQVIYCSERRLQL